MTKNEEGKEKRCAAARRTSKPTHAIKRAARNLKGFIERPSRRLVTGQTIFWTSRISGATFENRRYLSAELKYRTSVTTVGGAYFSLRPAPDANSTIGDANFISYEMT